MKSGAAWGGLAGGGSTVPDAQRWQVGFLAWSGHMREATSASLSHRCFPPSLPPSLKINGKINKKKLKELFNKKEPGLDGGRNPRPSRLQMKRLPIRRGWTTFCKCRGKIERSEDSGHQSF